MELIKEIRQGTITALFIKRKFGFLRNDETNEALYFHETALLNFNINQMRVGDTVGYREIPGRDNQKAAGHVRRLSQNFEEKGDKNNE